MTGVLPVVLSVLVLVPEAGQLQDLEASSHRCLHRMLGLQIQIQIRRLQLSPMGMLVGYREI